MEAGAASGACEDSTVTVIDRLYWRRYERQYDIPRVAATLSDFRRRDPEEARRLLATRLRDQLRALRGTPRRAAGVA